MARKSLFCQLLAGLVGRMTSLALPISLLEDCASFWHWLLPLYILSSQGKYFKSFIALWFRPWKFLSQHRNSWGTLHGLTAYLFFICLTKNGVGCIYLFYTLAHGTWISICDLLPAKLAHTQRAIRPRLIGVLGLSIYFLTLSSPFLTLKSALIT